MDRLTRIALAVISLIALVVIANSGRGAPLATSLPAATSAGRVLPVGSMHEKRADHTATLLRDGRVLITGGMVENGVFLNSAELYDPGKKVFVPTGPMQSRRVGQSATLLPDGKVLIAGGLAGRAFEGGPEVVASTEIYDPGTGRFTPGPAMNAPRSGHGAVLLSDGTVLIAGGSGADEQAQASAEIYDPVTGRFTPTASMHTPRVARSAVLLRDGRVLVTGGGGEGRNAGSSAEVYDPRRATWQAVGNMTSARMKHAAILLDDGRVLVTGGSPDWQWHAMRNAEIFDPRSGKFTAIADMVSARFKIPAAAVTLKNGNALIAGGAADVEVFDSRAEKFERAGTLDGPHFFASATLLDDGRVLISGGYGLPLGRQNGPLATDRAWVYQP